jgi:hypothetical protein
MLLFMKQAQSEKPEQSEKLEQPEQAETELEPEPRCMSKAEEAALIDAGSSVVA